MDLSYLKRNCTFLAQFGSMILLILYLFTVLFSSDINHLRPEVEDQAYSFYNLRQISDFSLSRNNISFSSSHRHLLDTAFPIDIHRRPRIRHHTVVMTAAAEEKQYFDAGNNTKGEVKDSSITISTEDADHQKWSDRIFHKLVCFKASTTAIYLYHVRKAAGTTIRDFFHLLARKQRVPFFETEGIVVNPSLLHIKELLTLVSFRDPIERIISLYWYEHVAWYYSVVKKHDKLKTLSEWINGWKDGAKLKTTIQSKFPTNNYVEIENYYTKLLIGYQYDPKKEPNEQKKLTKEDLEKAKEILRQFDLIFISEWINDKEHIERKVIHDIYKEYYMKQGNEDRIIAHKIKGDLNMRKKLGSTFAKDEVRFLICPTLSLSLIFIFGFRLVVYLFLSRFLAFSGFSFVRLFYRKI
jgi:hypothetical protein